MNSIIHNSNITNNNNINNNNYSNNCSSIISGISSSASSPLLHDSTLYTTKMMHTISHQPYAANQVSVGSHMLAGSQHHHMTSPLTSHVGASNGAVGPGPTGASGLGGYQQTTPPHHLNTAPTIQSQLQPPPPPPPPNTGCSLSNNNSTTSIKINTNSPPLTNSLLTTVNLQQQQNSAVTSQSVQQQQVGATIGSSQHTPLSNHSTPSAGGGGAGSTGDQQQQQHIAAANTPLTTGGSSLGVTDHQQFENDKKVIFNHPLFPLLQLLFDKCETATNSAECPSSASFDMDIENFINLHERDKKPFYTDNADANDVMIRAIQVLRIHLLELEKVNELCKDFCQRYIACLKNKMQSDTILGCGGGLASPGGTSSGLHPSHYPLSDSPNSQLAQQMGACGPVVSHPNALPHGAAGGIPHSTATAAGMQALYPQLSMFPGVAASAAAAAVAFPGAYQMNGASPGGPGHPGAGGPGGPGQATAAMLSGSTPISQVGLQHHPGAHGGHGHGASPLHPHHHLLAAHGQEMNPDGSFKKTKRGVLPKHATQIMRQWLFQHIVHPYPTEDEKRQIAVQTNLTLLQVNNWFINARRRILQPMLEASNPESLPKSKKSKNNRPTAVNRFWPDNLAQGQITTCKTECESPSPNDESNILGGAESGCADSTRGGEGGGTGGRDLSNNNMQLMSCNSPSALSDCSEDRSSNDPGMSPPPSSRAAPPAPNSNGPSRSDPSSNFMTNGFVDSYNPPSSEAGSLSSQQQGVNLFSERNS